MVVRTHKDTENATVSMIIFITLLLAIIAHVDYNNAETETVRNRCHEWLTVCYSIAGTFIFISLVKYYKKPDIPQKVLSQKEIEIVPV